MSDQLGICDWASIPHVKDSFVTEPHFKKGACRNWRPAPTAPQSDQPAGDYIDRWNEVSESLGLDHDTAERIANFIHYEVQTAKRGYCSDQPPQMLGPDALGNGNDHFGRHERNNFCEQRGCIAVGESTMIPSESDQPAQGERVIALPFQKELTVAMRKDASQASAKADVASIQKGSVVYREAGELYFHALRLECERDHSLYERVAVFYYDENGKIHPIGLKFKDELCWPVGFCQEAWDIETDIQALRIPTKAAPAVQPSPASADARDAAYQFVCDWHDHGELNVKEHRALAALLESFRAETREQVTNEIQAHNCSPASCRDEILWRKALDEVRAETLEQMAQVCDARKVWMREQKLDGCEAEHLAWRIRSLLPDPNWLARQITQAKEQLEITEVMGRSFAEIKRILAWYESLGSPSLVETDQTRELRRKSYEEAKANYDAIPPNINGNTLPIRSGEMRQVYTPKPSIGDQLRANMKETLDTYCPYIPRVEDAVAIHPCDLYEMLERLDREKTVYVLKHSDSLYREPIGLWHIKGVWYRQDASAPRRVFEIHPYDLAELLDRTVNKLGMDGKTEVIKCFAAAAIGPRGASTCVADVWYRMNADIPRRPGPHTIE